MMKKARVDTRPPWVAAEILMVLGTSGFVSSAKAEKTKPLFIQPLGRTVD